MVATSIMSDPERLLSPTEVRTWLGVSDTTVWRLRKAKDFPRPYPISAGRIGYRAGDLLDWRDKRRAEPASDFREAA